MTDGEVGRKMMNKWNSRNNHFSPEKTKMKRAGNITPILLHLNTQNSHKILKLFYVTQNKYGQTKHMNKKKCYNLVYCHNFRNKQNLNKLQ